MFWNSRQEEETFDLKPIVEREVSVQSKPDEPDMEKVMQKINTITHQINLISKYLSYLSQKFDKTIDNARTYDQTLDEIEMRINELKKKVDEVEIVSPDVDLADDRTQAI